MINDQGAKSQSNPNDQAPNPERKKGPGMQNRFWALVIGAWDLIGLLLLNFFPTLQSFSGRGGQ
jgi:hypothetical protein